MAQAQQQQKQPQGRPDQKKPEGVTAVVTLDQVREQIFEPAIADITGALPATVDIRRFESAFIIAFQNEPKLLKCRPDSIRNSLMRCAADGLVPDRRQAALVPFYSSEDKCLLAQYIPMYQGIIARARELGDLFSITANPVHKNDSFTYDEADITRTEHKRPPLDQARGDVIGAYAIFRDKDERVIHREILDLEAVNKIRAFSKAQNSPAWRDWFGEMARKSAIRRGSKFVPMSDALKQIIEREDEHVALNLTERPQRREDHDFNPLLRNQPIKDADHETAAQPGATDRQTPAGSSPDEGRAAERGAPTGAPGEAPASARADRPPHPQSSSTSGTGVASSGADTSAPVDRGPAPASSADARPLKDFLTGYSRALGRAERPASLTTLDEQFATQNHGYPLDNVGLDAMRKIIEIHDQRVQGKLSPKDAAAALAEVIGE